MPNTEVCCGPGRASGCSGSRSAAVPRFPANRVSSRAAADVTDSSGSSVTRPSAVAVPANVRVQPPSASDTRRVSASVTVPVPRDSVASPSTAYAPSSRADRRTEPR